MSCYAVTSLPIIKLHMDTVYNSGFDTVMIYVKLIDTKGYDRLGYG